MRRFIAGATCPLCHQLDTLYVDPDNKLDLVSCTRCDYEALRASDNTATHQTVPPVLKSEASDLNDKEAPVKFIKPALH